MSREPRTLLIGLIALLASCSSGDDTGLSEEAARGKVVYLSICTACHSADPTQEGSLGPALAGASKELIEAKMLRGEYPPNYTPKRVGAQMPRFENLAGSVDDLVAWLAALEQE